MCPKMSVYLLDELREVLGNNGEGSAAHGEVIALFLQSHLPVTHLLLLLLLLQVYLHRLKEDESVVTRTPENCRTVLI